MPADKNFRTISAKEYAENISDAVDAAAERMLGELYGQLYELDYMGELGSAQQCNIHNPFEEPALELREAIISALEEVGLLVRPDDTSF